MMRVVGSCVIAGISLAWGLSTVGQVVAPDARDLYRTREFNYWKWIARPMLTRDEFMHEVSQVGDITDAQRAIVGAVYDDYAHSFNVESAEIRTVADEVNNRSEDESGRDRYRERKESTWTPYPQLNWEKRRHELETALLEDVEAVLSTPQCREWRRVARRIRRDKWFTQLEQNYMSYPIGDLAGALERLDVAALIELIDDWERQVDSILQRMEHDWARLQIEDWRLRDADPDGLDPETQQRREEIRATQWSSMGDLVRLNVRIRDQILQVLPAEHHELFRDAYGLAMHPEIYAPSPADLAIHDLLTDKTLAPETQERVASIAERYRLRRRPILHELERIARDRFIDPGRFEEDRAEQVARYEMWRTEADANPDVFTIWEWEGVGYWRERFLLVHRTCRELRRAVPPEEFDALPAHVRFHLTWAE